MQVVPGVRFVLAVKTKLKQECDSQTTVVHATAIICAHAAARMSLPHPLWIPAPRVCPLVVLGALALAVESMVVITTIAVRSSNGTQGALQGTAIVALHIGSAPAVARPSQSLLWVFYCLLAKLATLCNVRALVVPSMCQLCLAAPLLGIWLLVDIAAFVLLRGCVRAPAHVTITGINHAVLYMPLLWIFDASLEHKHSAFVLNVLRSIVLARTRIVTTILANCVAGAVMLATFVMAAFVLVVAARGVVLALPFRAQDLCTFTLRARPVRFACPALELDYTSLLLHILGTLNFLASPLSNVCALLYHSICPFLLERDWCALEHCLKHFGPVSLPMFLMSP